MWPVLGRVLLYIENFSLREIVAKTTLGRCITIFLFSLF